MDFCWCFSYKGKPKSPDESSDVGSLYEKVGASRKPGPASKKVRKDNDPSALPSEPSSSSSSSEEEEEEEEENAQAAREKRARDNFRKHLPVFTQR
jgi:hypothetical protein